MFYKKELQKKNQKESRVEKVINRKGDKLYVKWKGYVGSVGLIKNILPYKNEFLPPYTYSKNKIEDKLYYSNYATKFNLKDRQIDR